LADAVIVMLGVTLAVTVMVIPALVAVALVTQLRDEVNTQVTTSPF